MKLLIFLHGTSIMHESAARCTREERVKQVRRRNSSVYDYASYIPVGNVVRKLREWEKQGAEILYLSSHKIKTNIAKDKTVLEKYNFPKGKIFFRRKGENYSEVAERILPDILIEDDCESIGGGEEIAYTYINPEVKRKIKSIVVKEFSGIDHLPDKIEALRSFER